MAMSKSNGTEVSDRVDGHADKRTGHPGSDLERLLHLAESLSEKCERYHTRLTWLMHYATGLGGAVISAAVIVWTFFEPDSPLRMPVTGALLGSASAVATVSLVYWRGLNQRKRKDQLALEEVTALLRGPATEILNGEELSPLQRALYRIRLARLDITPGAPNPRSGLVSNLWHWLRPRRC
jgi:hypothetical protein